MSRALLAVLIATALVYVRVATLGYVWDDHPLIEGNLTLAEPSWEAVFGRDLWWSSAPYGSSYYRPLLTVTFLVDRWLVGGVPATAHLHSLAWHLVATGLLGVLVAGRAGDTAGAWAAAVFALHPIQSEAVAWVSARNDVLVAVWILAALLAVDRGRVVLAGACAALAALSKETGVLTPLLALFWVRAWDRRVSPLTLLSLFIGVAAAMTLRNLATLGTTFPPFPFGPESRSGQLFSLVRYPAWIVWPWPLTSTTTSYSAAPGPDAFLAAGLAMWLGVQAVRAEPRRAGNLLAITVITLAPTAAATWFYSTLGERYLYLPLVGVAATVGPLLARIRRPLVPAAVVALGAAVTFARIPDWRDDLTLFTAAAMRQPDAYSLALAGKTILEHGDPAGAYAVLQASLDFEPAYPFACRFVTTAARDALTWEETLRREPSWRARHCGGIAGFDDALITTAALNQDWEHVARWLDTQFTFDRTGRRARVEAALLAHEGDLVGFAGACLQDPDGPAACRAGVLPLLQGRPAVAPATAPL